MKCSGCQRDVPPGKFCAQCGAPLSKTQKFGDYEVESAVGEGGMGRVYKAIQPRLNRVVCIKTLLPQYTREPQVRERFEREAAMTAQLKHPNIVSIIDVGRADDGSPYIVMEYVEGNPLRQVIREEAPIAPARAVVFVDQILAALAEAHAHGVVHRDLKPSNVLVTALKDGTEHCKVLDFGIARNILSDNSDAKLTRTGMMMGTPGYMAPEQIGGNDFDHRVDLYACGVMLYEMLVGQRMFRAPSEIDLLKLTLLEDPPAPSSRVSTPLPALLDAVTLKAVSRDPKKRFASAIDFREALGRSLGSSVSVFATPAQRLAVEHTVLASAVADQSRSSANPRALLSAVLSTEEDWALTRLLEAFDRSVNEMLDAEELNPIGMLLRALQEEAKERAGTEPFKAVVATLRTTFLFHLSKILQWTADATRSQVAWWMVRVIGRDGVLPLLETLQTGTREEQTAAADGLRLVEPKVTDLVERVRTLPSAVMKVMVGVVSKWPEADAATFVTAALNSTSAPHRHAALEGLTESLALRNMNVIRIRLHDPTASIRAEALKWIFRLEDHGALPDLEKELERTTVTPAERRMIYRALGRLRPEGVAVLLQWLNRETDPESVRELVNVLVQTGDPTATEVLRAAAANPKTPRPLRDLLGEVLRSFRT